MRKPRMNSRWPASSLEALVAIDAVVLPPEGDAVAVEGDQAAVGDGEPQYGELR
jgi:hypothetical protein